MRLDSFLFEAGYFSSRNKAAECVKRGEVLLDGKVEKKPSKEVSGAEKIEIISPKKFVSLGGYKLDKALSDFSVDVNGLTFADIGASTGGFTDCLLQRGAKKVYFVEKNRKNAEMIKQNLETCKASKDEFEIDVCDYASMLEKTNEKFDFVYMDPPYKNLEFYLTAAKILKERNLLNNDALLICEHDAKQEILLPSFSLISRKKYGIKMLSYFILEMETQPLPNFD